MKMFLFIFLAGFISLGFSLESNFYREEPCAKIQGYCTLEKECPHSVEGSHRNLCSGQKNEGAVCCKNFPNDQLNCFQTHNACVDAKSCPKNLNLGPKGCKGGATCCVAV